MQYLYTAKHIILLNENKKDINIWKDKLCSEFGRHYYKVVNSPQIDLQIQHILNQNLNKNFFVEDIRAIKKIITWKYKKSKTAMAIFKKWHRFKQLILPYIKIHQKAKLGKTAQY